MSTLLVLTARSGVAKCRTFDRLAVQSVPPRNRFIHAHADTDEVFIILRGELSIEFRDVSVTLKEGELLVIPKGIEHKPCAEEECHLLLAPPAGTINSGDAGGELTSDEEWI